MYKKMAEKPLDKIHLTFAQNVSHELRTPLTILYGYAEMLAGGDMGELTAAQQQVVNIITGRARMLGKLIERIEVLLAIEANLTASVPLAFAEMVTQVVEGKRQAAARSGIALEVQIEPNISFMWGDPHLLRQAVECLLENALKFTPSGGQVTVQLYTELDQVCLAVADTGIGMASQELEHVLDGFYQADSSITRRYGGLGLGLTIVKAVIAEHGGTIQIESRLGQGSRFVVSFPAMQADSLPDASMLQAANWLLWSASTDAPSQ